MKIAVVGPGGSGKDHVCETLQRISRLRFWGSTSRVILPHAARRLGLSEPAAWASRHLHREAWAAIGDELRAGDPAALARAVLQGGDLCNGVRRRSELVAAQVERLVQLTVWIDRDVPPDPSLDYGPEMADLILLNRGTLADLHGRLDRLANALGVLKILRP